MSTSNFHQFATAVALHFRTLATRPLYRVDITGDELWQAYLAAFPEGTNPLFRVRTEHDGSYDRNFIRQLGNVVAIDGTHVTTIWDIQGLPEPYQTVANAMALTVRNGTVCGIFKSKEAKYGYVRTFEKREDGDPIEWFHFNAAIPAQHVVRSPAEHCGTAASTVDVVRRGALEISPNAVCDVLDLVYENQLYRGEEFKAALQSFGAFQNRFLLASEKDRAAMVWSEGTTNGALRIRNTAIGTLLQELSEGVALDIAVQRYERMVAPTNYKRPTAAITAKMIETAISNLREQGLESALERRHATLADISINNVLWADNQAQAHMKDGLTAMLMTAVKTTAPDSTKVQEISIADFQRDVLPDAKAMRLFLANAMQGNLASITTATDPTAKRLFKWDNNFAWSYNGDITDSIKERVKAAGGNTNAALRVSLAWFNGDDLDIHAWLPDGAHIYFGNKCSILDVDMNAGGPRNSTDPVENLSWTAPQDGVYKIEVVQYRKRANENIGFMLEIENDGKITQFSYPKAVSGTIKALEFSVERGKITALKVSNADIVGQGISRNVWSLNTEQYVRVETALNSPNHWDNQNIGNKHWFFTLEGCKNPDPCRGIYNEFLRPEMDTHRKVLEVLGSKTKAPYTEQQLSGVGFSSTKRESAILQVDFNNATRTYKVNF